jgi:hypothetical protein
MDAAGSTVACIGDNPNASAISNDAIDPAPDGQGQITATRLRLSEI